jgi:hypothetical protein
MMRARSPKATFMRPTACALLVLASLTAGPLAFAQADADAGAPPVVPPSGAAPTPAPAGTDANPPEPKKDDEKKDDKGAPTDPLMTGTAGARAAGLAPPGVNYSNFMDTRLTWTFGDDDVLHSTGELTPLSPTFSIGDRPQYRLFFDNLNSRFAGRENITHLVLYKKLPGFIPNLTTEASVVLRFDLASLAANTGSLNNALYDSGSYIRLFYKTGGDDKKPAGISAVFFPLDTDRVRLGYLYDISWGGTAANINQSIFPRIQGSSPGLKVQFDVPNVAYAYAAFKTAQIVQPVQVLNPGGENDVETVRVGETNYGIMGGGGFDPASFLRFDLGGGYFQQGKFDLEDVRGQPVYTYGGSARMVVHDNMPVPQSIDFQLYRNDPMAPMSLFALPKYEPGKVSWAASIEGDVLMQHLKNYDQAGKTKDQAAFATAIQGVLTAGYLRVSATGIVRDLNFVVRNVPGFIPFQTLPSTAKTDLELFAALAADYHIAGAHLTPGISGGFQLPSTFTSEFTDGAIQGSRTIVVRSQGDQAILPYGKGRTAIVQGRLSLRWDISTFLAMVGWMQLVYDNNATLVVRDPVEGTASLRVFQSPTRLGFGAALQARF